jgi:hypothetical protein
VSAQFPKISRTVFDGLQLQLNRQGVFILDPVTLVVAKSIPLNRRQRLPGSIEIMLVDLQLVKNSLGKTGIVGVHCDCQAHKGGQEYECFFWHGCEKFLGYPGEESKQDDSPAQNTKITRKGNETEPGSSNYGGAWSPAFQLPAKLFRFGADLQQVKVGSDMLVIPLVDEVLDGSPFRIKTIWVECAAG